MWSTYNSSVLPLVYTDNMVVTCNAFGAEGKWGLCSPESSIQPVRRIWPHLPMPYIVASQARAQNDRMISHAEARHAPRPPGEPTATPRWRGSCTSATAPPRLVTWWRGRGNERYRRGYNPLEPSEGRCALPGSRIHTPTGSRCRQQPPYHQAPIDSMARQGAKPEFEWKGPCFLHSKSTWECPRASPISATPRPSA